MIAPEVVRYRTSEGVRTAIIVDRGRKFLHVIPMEDRAVRVRKVPLTEERLMEPLTLRGKPYPPKRAVRHFARHGKGFGITKKAKSFLKEVKNSRTD
jgi:hypothetical protein